jgi:glycosyltransferase involved in cell wall biosynthesis
MGRDQSAARTMNEGGSGKQGQRSTPSKGAIVIPCFNHADTVNSVITELQSVVPSLPIVVVDDGSNPAVEVEPPTTVLRHSSNKGKTVALVTGVNHVKDSDFVVFVDADGQHPIEFVPELIRSLDSPSPVDLTTASRDFFRDSSIPLRHRLANLTLALEFALINGKYIPDVTNGLRAIRTGKFLAIDFAKKGYQVEIETLSFLLKNGGHIRSVPVHGSKYQTKSAVGRGIHMTASLGLSMLVDFFRSSDNSK